MASKTSKRKYLQELDRLAPEIRKQFLAWVGDRVGIAKISEVEKFVRSNNVDGLLNSIGADKASLANFTEAVRDTYKAGGAFEAGATTITFDITNPGAEAWLRNNSSRLVTNILQDQQEAIRVALESGMRAGNNPRTTALEIVGRTSKVTGRRSGGVVGLSRPQTAYVSKARAQLLSGNADEMRAYLTRVRRDKRFDGTVKRAIAEGRALTLTEANKLTGRYADRLLKLRGETIARTETLTALNAARDQAWKQAIDEGKVLADFVTSTWSSTMDKRTRDSHRVLNGQTNSYGEPFRSPTGAHLMYPGDTSLGARAEDVVNCRCFLQRQADFIAQAAYQYGGR